MINSILKQNSSFNESVQLQDGGGKYTDLKAWLLIMASLSMMVRRFRGEKRSPGQWSSRPGGWRKKGQWGIDVSSSREGNSCNYAQWCYLFKLLRTEISVKMYCIDWLFGPMQALLSLTSSPLCVCLCFFYLRCILVMSCIAKKIGIRSTSLYYFDMATYVP